MAYRILQTKLYMPTTSNLVPRCSLLSKLDNYSSNKITIVTAPAGYGKSTLVCLWLQKSNLDYSWFSIDEKDNSPAVFWAYFCEGLRKYDNELAQKAALLLQQSDKIDYCEFVDWLLETLIKLTRKRNRPPKLVIVLDDLHCISNKPLIESINRFIDYMPQWVYIVATCRQIPDLSVSHRRSKLQLNLITRNELAFDIDETSSFLYQKLMLKLEKEQLTELYRQTEGWAAAVQLSGLSIKAGSCVNNSILAQDDLLSDFLFEQVFHQLDSQIKEILLSMSVVPRFCAELCNALNDFNQGRKIIDQLLDANLLLVSLDDEGKWFRFHALFQEWLLGYLENESSHKLVKLRDNAIQWLDANQFYDEALEIALLKKDWEWSSLLFSKAYSTLSQLHSTREAEHILKLFPASIIESRPQLALAKAIFHFAVFQYNEANDYLTLVDHKVEEAKSKFALTSFSDYSEYGLNNQNDFFAIEGASKFIRSHMARFSGDTQLASSLCDEILRDSSFDDPRLLCWCYCGLSADNFLNDEMLVCIDYAYKSLSAAKQVGDGHCVIASLNWLLSALLHNGKPQLAEKIALENLAWLKEQAMECLPDIGVLYSHLMSLQRELNKLDEAWNTYQILQRHKADRTDPRNNINGKYIASIQLFASCNQVDEALELTTELESYIKSNFGAQKYVAGFDVCKVYAGLQLKKGKFQTLLQWTKEQSEQSGIWRYQYENERLFYSIVNMIKGNDVLALLDNIEAVSERRGVTKRVIETYLIRAQFFVFKGDQVKAKLAFFKALELSASCDFVSLMIDEASVIKPLLKLAITENIASEYCHNLLHEIKKRESLLADKINAAGNDKLMVKENLVSALTPREVDVLRLIGKGYTNKEISERLSLAASTVKSHLNNIYSKLNVKRRTEALIKSRELELL